MSTTPTAKPSPVGAKTMIWTSEDKPTEFGIYIAEKAGEFAISEENARKIHAAIRANQQFDGNHIENNTLRKKLEAAFKDMTPEWAQHLKWRESAKKRKEKEVEEKKAAREAEKAAAEQSRKESSEAFAVALADKDAPVEKPVAAIAKTGDTAFNLLLGDKMRFNPTTGVIEVKKNAELTMTDFASAFGGFHKMNDATSQVREKAGLVEARLGILAKKHLGADRWLNLFAQSAGDRLRVSGNVRTLEWCAAIGEEGERLLRVLPLSNVQKTISIKVTDKDTAGTKEKADAENLAAKKEIAKRTLKKVGEMQELGQKISQKEILQIIADYKKELGIEAKVSFSRFYVFIIGGAVRIAGSVKDDPAMQRACNRCITASGEIMVMSTDGKGVIKDDVKEPTEEILEYVRKMTPAEAPATPSSGAVTGKSNAQLKKEGKSKAAAPVSAPVVEPDGEDDFNTDEAPAAEAEEGFDTDEVGSDESAAQVDDDGFDVETDDAPATTTEEDDFTVE